MRKLKIILTMIIVFVCTAFGICLMVNSFIRHDGIINAMIQWGAAYGWLHTAKFNIDSLKSIVKEELNAKTNRV